MRLKLDAGSRLLLGKKSPPKGRQGGMNMPSPAIRQGRTVTASRLRAAQPVLPACGIFQIIVANLWSGVRVADAVRQYL
jgi:hypothetical protein